MPLSIVRRWRGRLLVPEFCTETWLKSRKPSGVPIIMGFGRKKTPQEQEAWDKYQRLQTMRSIYRQRLKKLDSRVEKAKEEYFSVRVNPRRIKNGRSNH